MAFVKGMISTNIIRRAGVVTTVAAIGALVSFAAGGCGGAGITVNGLQNKTGPQVARDAAGVIGNARSVHVKGVIFSPRYRYDVRIQGSDADGTMTVPGGQAEIMIIGSKTGLANPNPDIYLKAGPDVLKKLFGTSAPVQDLAGRWLKLPQSSAAWLPGFGFHLSDFTAALDTFFSPPGPAVRQATLGGRKVVVVSYRDGSKLYVANTGPAYPLRWDDNGPGAGWTDFTGYGADFHISAPGNAVNLTGYG